MKRRIQSLRTFISFPYIIINCIFIFILLGILVYSALFSAAENNYPLHSSLEILHEDADISSGLSHSFSEIVRGHFDSAREYNKYGLQIFLFFFLQLILRPVFTFLYMRHHQTGLLIHLDAGISVIFFVLCFLPFIERFIEIVIALI
ncbi:MAG: hypothetical protein JW973_00785 [Bacteroidales bacterium]|nr:hypothetical protein [Bacteroidales bacterium]